MLPPPSSWEQIVYCWYGPGLWLISGKQPLRILMPTPPAFDPFLVPENNASGYPVPYNEAQTRRFNRRLGDHAGLTKFGVVLTRIAPGGQSSHRHAHSTQDEFIFVLEGETVLNT